jgi:hypothetical protein
VLVDDRPRCRGVCIVATRHPQAFVTSKPLALLVIDDSAPSACVVVGGAEPTAWMAIGVPAQPSPQGDVGIIWCHRDGFTTLGRAVLPELRAAEPFADPSTRCR